MKRIVLIGHDKFSVGSTPDFGCRRLTWCEARNLAAPIEADLLVGEAPPTPSEAEDYFEWLVKVAGARPILAIVPPEAAILQMACRVAEDFIALPVESAELTSRVSRILGLERDRPESIHSRLLDEFGMAELVGTDPRFLAAVSKLPQIGRSNCTVLITGETGTGGEAFRS